MESVNPEFAAFYSTLGALGLISYSFPSSDFSEGAFFPSNQMLFGDFCQFVNMIPYSIPPYLLKIETIDNWVSIGCSSSTVAAIFDTTQRQIHSLFSLETLFLNTILPLSFTTHNQTSH